ncbi:tRNA(Ile)(2)-agmatinylcytidine synthase [Candidatus Nitrosocosmicus franklandus]|uniref:tRNA(Ile2) 2-agmatinylcytidine synthetase TiaS n=1 Tax=Candidatus Nitrosocosmicus franklandianus TaxID=1798806 RepID=A0A484IAC6_9ARCH|nr:tRNA(Ile)(2)-agmatinylcytidine synthase [Candidatus Nitrosocosmicus franklandus]VFJ13782.1 tRNA(Ile2) 2-agmatinylcytidine synthetase TiaS [Candidatus Nitrosocosmicus franklandus]
MMMIGNNAFNTKILHIGIDDTDSINGRCTTHLSYLIAGILVKKFHAEFIDFPLLIRLNPNVPFKTRGNGAVCLRIKCNYYEKIKEEITQIVEKYSEIGYGANPGLAFYEENNISKDLLQFSKNAMDTILSKQLAIKIAKKNNIQFRLFGKGHGIVGALSAIGCLLDSDHTFETLAYRREQNIGKIRKTNDVKVKRLSDESYPYTYNNFDKKNSRILITPHGPDPVFCGIRGEDPLLTLFFLKNLCIEEELDGYMIFRSNQGTNLHLTKENKVTDMKPYTAGHINCEVATTPNTIKGGHVIFKIKDKYNCMLPVAVYQPTGLTKIAKKLTIGDKIEIGYGVHLKSNNQTTLNLEYLVVKELVRVFEVKNPVCTKCSKSMKSEGKNKGYQCSVCKTRIGSVGKIKSEKDREINSGLYIPEPIAHRHLTKPLPRYGIEKRFDRFDIILMLKSITWIKNSGGLI